MVPMVHVRGLERRFPTPGGACHALRGIDLDVAAGEFVAVTGRSGSGKSTLLHLLAGIDRPSAGTVRVADTDVLALAGDRLSSWRGRTVGIVFQAFHLLPTLTVAENVMLPMDFAGAIPARERRARALALLDRVGVAAEAERLPAAISGGQQQRVAIARALANDPPLVIADEPTGNLDSVTGAHVFALLRGLADEGRTVIVVTHERDAHGGRRTLELLDGRVA